VQACAVLRLLYVAGHRRLDDAVRFLSISLPPSFSPSLSLSLSLCIYLPVSLSIYLSLSIYIYMYIIYIYIYYVYYRYMYIYRSLVLRVTNRLLIPTSTSPNPSIPAFQRRKLMNLCHNPAY